MNELTVLVGSLSLCLGCIIGVAACYRSFSLTTKKAVKEALEVGTVQVKHHYHYEVVKLQGQYMIDQWEYEQRRRAANTVCGIPVNIVTIDEIASVLCRELHDYFVKNPHILKIEETKSRAANGLGDEVIYRIFVNIAPPRFDEPKYTQMTGRAIRP